MTTLTKTPIAGVVTTFVLATRNAHKVREIAALLEELPVRLVGIDELAPGVPLVEDQDSFEGNAYAKAEQAAAATGLPSLADDSGLEVDELGGAPGVWSARYAGEPSDDARNNARLLRELAGVPPEKRGARYRCVAAFVDPATGARHATSGECEGMILEAPRGSGGFGYDPLFLIPALGQTMAEIDQDRKNRLSHRAAAFQALAAVLRGT
jgi:XTP/dITP diphosphohydrolase